MKSCINKYCRLEFNLRKDVQALVVLLAASYVFSLMARLHWFFDLFSHFSIQYTIGGIILGSLLLMLKSKKFALLALVIALANIFEIYRHADFSSFSNPASGELTVVQYNRHFNLFDYTDPKQWITDNAGKFDLIVIQEASARAERLARDMASIYPHNILEARNNAFGMVVISKYPFIEQELIDLGEYIFIRSFALRMVIQPPESAQPIEIFALHAIPPMAEDATIQRNHEIGTLAGLIAGSKHGATIMMGDWNLTPYSPYFHDLSQKTGLREALWFGLLPMPTWPAQFVLPIIQIPIDHIMYRGELKATKLERGPAMGSDHYPVIATFALPKAENR